MRVCIVGNGPSAEGHGAEIDACDFVVRIKAFWVYGAENVGQRCDAVATYGDWRAWRQQPPFSGEYWISQTLKQIEENSVGWERLAFISRIANLQPLRWLPQPMWDSLLQQIGSHPSTGIVAVCMGLAIIQPDELLLYGFDGTTPDKPNYHDARRPNPNDPHAHDQLAEKRAIAELLDGQWMGEPSRVKLTWPDMPDMPEAGDADA